MKLEEKHFRVIRIVGAVFVFAGIGALWKLTGLSSEKEITEEARPFLRDDATPVLVSLIYVVGVGLAFFPALPLIIATGLVFPPWEALAYAGGGSLGAAVLGYLVGRRIGPGRLERILGKKVHDACITLRDAGLVGMAAVRLFPAAPFTLISLVAGAVRVSFWSHFVGSVIGLAPGVLIFSLLGYQIRSGGKMWLTGLTLAAAFGLGALGWFRARRKQRHRHGR